MSSERHSGPLDGPLVRLRSGILACHDRCRGEFRFFPVYPETIKDGEMASFVAEVAAERVGRNNVVRDQVITGAEICRIFCGSQGDTSSGSLPPQGGEGGAR